MDYEFNADEWNAMAPAGRVQRCRLLSRETHRLTQKAPPELQPIDDHMAEQWEKASLGN